MPERDNTVTWFEIGTPDVEGARKFFGGLFDWSFAPDGDYTLISAPGAAAPSGGIMNTAPVGAPPYAIICVKVPDVAAAVAKAGDLGGKVVVGPMTLPDGMSVAYLADPNESLFAVYKPKA